MIHRIYSLSAVWLKLIGAAAQLTATTSHHSEGSDRIPSLAQNPLQYVVLAVAVIVPSWWGKPGNLIRVTPWYTARIEAESHWINCGSDDVPYGADGIIIRQLVPALPLTTPSASAL